MIFQASNSPGKTRNEVVTLYFFPCKNIGPQLPNGGVNCHHRLSGGSWSRSGPNCVLWIVNPYYEEDLILSLCVGHFSKSSSDMGKWKTEWYVQVVFEMMCFCQMIHKESKTCPKLLFADERMTWLRRLIVETWNNGVKACKGGKLFAVSILDNILVNAIMIYDDECGRWSILWDGRMRKGTHYPKVFWNLKNRTPIEVECSIVVHRHLLNEHGNEHDPFNHRKCIFKQWIFQPALLIYHRVQIRGSFRRYSLPFIEENLWQQNQKSIKIDPFWQRQDSFFWTKKTSAASCFSKSSRFSVVISFWLLHQEMFDRAGIDSLEEWGRKVFIQEMRH